MTKKAARMTTPDLPAGTYHPRQDTWGRKAGTGHVSNPRSIVQRTEDVSGHPNSPT